MKKTCVFEGVKGITWELYYPVMWDSNKPCNHNKDPVGLRFDEHFGFPGRKWDPKRHLHH